MFHFGIDTVPPLVIILTPSALNSVFVAANVQEELSYLVRDVSHLKNVSLFIFTCKLPMTIVEMVRGSMLHDLYFLQAFPFGVTMIE